MFVLFRRVLLVLVLINICGAWYIDPGATSLIWQVIVSGVVGIGFTLRHSISTIIRRFRRRDVDDK